MVLADKDFNVGGSLSGRSTLTDEAVMDEASRYPVSHSRSLFSLGFQGVSSSTLFLGPVKALLVLEWASNGSKGLVAVAMDWDPLRVVLFEDNLVLDGRKELPCVLVGSDGGTELAIVPVGSVFVRPLV